MLDRPGESHEVDAVLQAFMDERIARSMSHFSQSDAGLIHHHVPTALDISASEIRHMLKHDQAIDYPTPLSVVKYIQNNQLYRS